MTHGRREAEAIVLAMFAAAPLYFTAAIDIPSIALFHVAMGLILALELRSPGFETPRILLRLAAISYLLFYFFDSAVLSRSLIRGTAHLLFFIAAYQSLDRSARGRVTQRLLVTFLLAVASIATSTHLTIMFFVVAFAMLVYRQLVSLNREETLRLVGSEYDDRPPGRVAAAYVLPMLFIAALIFPFLPRVRDPFVRGFANSLQTSTGFSDSIDLSEARSITTDPRVVARVRLSREAMQLFAPVRLRGGHYDRRVGDRWIPSKPDTSTRYVRQTDDGFKIANPQSYTGTIGIEQTRFVRNDQKLFIPVGTYEVTGVRRLVEGRNIGSYFLPGRGQPVISYEARVSGRVVGLRPEDRLPRYQVTDAVRRLADQIAVNATTTRENAVVIERYLATTFDYLSNAEVRDPISTETFLLEAKQGHCEHFAAGMVMLLAARGIPARIAGGYYGGERNPLTGYFVIRQRDAHAWVEVWHGDAWVTYDPTPADLRPGTDVPNLFMTYLAAVSDSANFFWDRYILSFGLSDQVNLALQAIWSVRDVLASLRRGAASTPAVKTLLVALVVTAFVALMVVLAARGRLRTSLFDKLVVRLRHTGINIRPDWTTDEILDEVESRRPQLVPLVKTIVECYRRERFSPAGASLELSGAAENALRLLREVKG